MRDISDVDVCPRCQKCDRWRTAPDYLREPMILWERFPCPPPGTDHARLLLELDWTGQIGTNDGCEALKRVAKRCQVDLKRIDSIPASLVECEELFDVISFCGTQCVIAVVLACICFLFFLLLIVVCVRYVRRTDKESSQICTKVLTSEHAAVNTQVNKYYAQNQYFHRPTNIPERRGLPCEARLVDTGVEARLLRAIHEVPVHHYNVEDLCPQCLAESRQNTLQYGRSRPGYESICWKDKDYFQKRVPSNDSLNRKSMNSQRSANGSYSDVSHLYEYISDYPYAPSYNSTGRKSSQSSNYYSRNVPHNLQETQYFGDARHSTDTETDTPPRHSDTDSCNRNELKPSRRSVTSIHSKYEDRSPYARYWTERVPYQPYVSDKSTYQRNLCDRALHKGYFSDTPPEINYKNNKTSDLNSIASTGNTTTDDSEIKNLLNHMITVKMNIDNPKEVKGYKYTYNPSYNEENKTSTTKDAVLPTSNSELFHKNDTPSDSRKQKPQKRKGRNRSKSSDSYNSNCSESTSLSDSFNKLTATNSSRKHRNYYNSTKTSDN